MHPVAFRIVPSRPVIQAPSGTGTEFVLSQRILPRILAFCGHSIDELVDNPIVKNKVRGWYKAHRQIQRRSEILELEQWWNG